MFAQALRSTTRTLLAHQQRSCTIAIVTMATRNKSTVTYNFAGQRAIVTGAGKGIGYDLSLALAAAGADVIAIARTQSDLDALKKEGGDRIKPVVLDVSDTTAIKEKLSNVGDIDMVVNNAGIANLQEFMEVDAEKFDQVMNINVRGALVVSQIAAKNMIDRGVKGSIVNVSSQGSKVGLTNHTSYCTSKGALDQLTRTMAMELGAKGIRCNAVLPTVVLTELGRAAWTDPVAAKPMLARIPLNRFAEIEDVVKPILFLLSDDASMINGAFVPIDGGFLSTGI